MSWKSFIKSLIPPIRAFNDFPKTPVIILTHDGANPLGIARSLGRHGVHVYVLTPDQRTSVSWSRYVKKVFTLSSLKNKKEIQERLGDFMYEVGSQFGKPILLVTNESHYLDLEPLKEFVNEHFISCPSLEKAIPLAIKGNQFPLATQAGFRVMETSMLRNVDDLNDIEKKLTFPVLVRPVSNNFRGEFEEKATLYENIGAMRKHLHPLLTEDRIELIAQEYIPGSDHDIVFFMASCEESGEPRIWLSGHKIRQNPPKMGLMCAGVLDPVPDVAFEKKCIQLCRLLRLCGFIGIEAKVHATTKEYCYIETSIRTEGCSSIGFAAGVDLVWDSYLTALNKPCGVVRPEKFKGSWAYAELEHGTMKILRQQGDPDWWKVFVPLPRPIAYAFFTWDDPLPFFHSLGTLLWRKIKKLFAKVKTAQS